MRRFISARALAVTAVAVAAGTLAPTASTALTPSTASTAVPLSRSTDGSVDDPASIGVRLLDAPADLADDPRARQYIIDNLMPGTTIHRRIQVVNKSAATTHVEMYPDAAAITHGSFAGAAGKTPNDLTTWTKLDHTSLDIPAGDAEDDTVTIAVPRDAAPREQYAVVWAQVSGARGTSGVSLVSRTGIRLYLCVGGHNARPAAFTVDTMTAERNSADRPVILARVHNTGGRAVDLSGTLKLTAVSGSLSAGPYPVQLGTSLAPGQSEAVTVPITDQVADGPWNATIDLKSGLLDETAHARITFPHNPGFASAALATSTADITRPMIIGALVGMAVLLGVTVPLTAIRRRRRSG